MKELLIKVKYNNDTAEYTSLDVQRALENVFGINTDFEVERIKTDWQRRRKKRRVNISFPVEYILSGEKETAFTTVSRNLSLEGINLLGKDFLPPKENVKLNINLINKTAEVKTQVVWCCKRNDSEKYHIGMRFLDMSEKGKKYLQFLLT